MITKEQYAEADRLIGHCKALLKVLVRKKPTPEIQSWEVELAGMVVKLEHAIKNIGNPQVFQGIMDLIEIRVKSLTIMSATDRWVSTLEYDQIEYKVLLMWKRLRTTRIH